MRKLLGLVVLLIGSPIGAAPNETSNPAFLGVGMQDMHSAASGTAGPCMIMSVTKDSGAHQAGILQNDIIVAIDNSPITSCDTLVTAIQRHEPGVNVKIQVKRGGPTVTLEATLPSRADVLRKRFVGKPMPLTTVIRVDDQSVGDLTPRSKTTIVGWFDQESCISCASAFSSIQSWAKTKGAKTGISVVGVTTTNHRSIPETVKRLKETSRGYDVPLLVADPETFGRLSITDNKRIHFLVIDPRGIVCYATPLKPDADDKEAVLGELYAATEQAARRTR